jgi:putative oxidoreductase
VLHGISTLSSYRQYLDPFDNLLFFAAWPMLAACVALFLLRDLDTKWTLGAAT